MEVRKKQDGALPRTPEDLERKYEFEKRFRELKEMLEAAGEKEKELFTKKLVAELIQTAKVQGLSAPEKDSEAANKGYVDQGLNEKVSKGYGLGEIPHKSVDVNAELTTGYFRTVSTTANTSFTHGAAHVRAYDKNEVVQNLIRVPTGIEQVRRTTDGGATWTVEYVNPPLNVGTEYCTTERYDGKTVYAKLIDVGALPNSSTKSAAHGIDSLFTSAMPISIEVFTSNGSTFQHFPFIGTGGNVVGKVHLTATSIIIITFYDVTAYTDTKVLVKYTKN